MFGTCFQILVFTAARLAGAFERLARLAGRLLEAIAGAIWPEACIACGSLGGADGLCAPCAAEVRALSSGPRCGRCDAALEAAEAPARSCRACRGRPLGVSRVVALGPHEGALRLALRRYKFYGRAASARPLGRLIAGRLRDEGLARGIDAVASVPATPGRERERGFDQAAALAREVAAALGVPYAAGALERPAGAAGAEQKSLGRRDRWKAAREAFRPSAQAAALLGGRWVLLVDDVCTSGATVAACAAACRAAGARSVLAACVTRQARKERAIATRGK